MDMQVIPTCEGARVHFTPDIYLDVDEDDLIAKARSALTGERPLSRQYDPDEDIYVRLADHDIWGNYDAYHLEHAHPTVDLARRELEQLLEWLEEARLANIAAPRDLT
jgi:hypothetical protein